MLVLLDLQETYTEHSSHEMLVSLMSFEVFVMSTHWLCGYLTDSLYMSLCGINTTHEGMMCHVIFPGQKLKGQSHKGHNHFMPCPLLGSAPTRHIRFICDQPMRG